MINAIYEVTEILLADNLMTAKVDATEEEFTTAKHKRRECMNIGATFL